MSTHEAKRFINRGNTQFNILSRTTYGKPYISLGEVINYSANKAMLFWIVASLFNTYILVNYMTDNDKYLLVGLSMFLTQAVYNWLDLNSNENLEKLQFYSTNCN